MNAWVAGLSLTSKVMGQVALSKALLVTSAANWLCLKPKQLDSSACDASAKWFMTHAGGQCEAGPAATMDVIS